MILSLRQAQKHPLFLPLALALGLHLVFVLLAMVVRLPGLQEIARRATATFHVASVNMRPSTPRKPVELSTSGFAKQLKFVGRTADSAIRSVPDVPVRPILDKKQIMNDPVTHVPPAPAPVRPLELESRLESRRDLDQILLTSEERQHKEQVEPKRAPVPGHVPAPEIEKSARMARAQGLIKFLSLPSFQLPAYTPANMEVDPQEGMPGFTPSHVGGPGLSDRSLSADQKVDASSKDARKYEPLDELLDIEVYTYQHTDRTQYFMIKIFAKKGVALKVMPKEVIFAVDASLSISKDRMEEFKQGIRRCLSQLNPGDVFNLVAFKDTPAFFSPQSIAADAASIRNAERFVGGLTPSEQTDVYMAFNKIVTLPVARTPSNVILISDGRATHGVVSSRELINSITRINDRTRPIFAYSGGARVNRYLLDFIAYQNRGWSEYVKKQNDIDKGLASLYQKVKDPIFLNLRYRLSNLDEADVFPRSLPDFYRGAEFTLFGTFREASPFSMQLLGDIDGKTSELIFTRSLADALPGTPEIMRGYAFNKIYHLVSEATRHGTDAARTREIQELSRRYGVTTPYSPELEKID